MQQRKSKIIDKTTQRGEQAEAIRCNLLQTDTVCTTSKEGGPSATHKEANRQAEEINSSAKGNQEEVSTSFGHNITQLT